MDDLTYKKLEIHENQVSLEYWKQNPFIAIYSNLHIASNKPSNFFKIFKIKPIVKSNKSTQKQIYSYTTVLCFL